jgi:hypothetical protein
MKILLQNVRTGCFYSRYGWVSDKNAATEFQCSADAVEIAIRFALEESRLHFSFNDSSQDFSAELQSSAR